TGQAQNPYLAPYFNQAAEQLTAQFQNAIEPSILAQGIKSGTFGSTGNASADLQAQDALSQGLASLAAQIYEPAYGQERQLQLGAQQAMNQEVLQGQPLADQLQLGMGNLALGAQQADTARMLGLGQLQLGGQSLADQFALGQGNLNLAGQQLAGQLALGQ